MTIRLVQDLKPAPNELVSKTLWLADNFGDPYYAALHFVDAQGALYVLIDWPHDDKGVALLKFNEEITTWDAVPYVNGYGKLVTAGLVMLN
jgi:hypothetical protein